jgi:hypothetical protein
MPHLQILQRLRLSSLPEGLKTAKHTRPKRYRLLTDDAVRMVRDLYDGPSGPSAVSVRTPFPAAASSNTTALPGRRQFLYDGPSGPSPVPFERPGRAVVHRQRLRITTGIVPRSGERSHEEVMSSSDVPKGSTWRHRRPDRDQAVPTIEVRTRSCAPESAPEWH